MIRHSEKNIPAADEGHGIRIRHVCFCVVMVLALLSLISYSPRDWNVFAGGVSAIPDNWIGSLGARFSHNLLLFCGLAGYIAVLLFLLRSVRLFFAGAGRSGIFFSGTALTVSGAMLLFAIFPETFAGIASNLGLGRRDEPALIISGGIIGQFFAAPPYGELSPGCLRDFIGVVGTQVVGWIMVIAGGVMVYASDWHALVKRMVFAGGEAVDTVRKHPLWQYRRDADDDEEYEDDENGDAELQMSDPEPEDDAENDADVPEKTRKSGLGKWLDRLNNAGDDADVTAPVPAVAANAGRPDELPISEPSPQPAVPAAAAPAVMETPEVAKTVVEKGEKLRGEYGEFVLPLVTMLAEGKNVIGESREAIELAQSKIQQTLEEFSISGKVTGYVTGPRVTRYEITLAPGINVKKVEQIQDNIRMALATTSIRVLAPIPGRSVVGIEVSNSKPEAVFMRSILESEEWRNSKAEIPLALGKNVSGKPVVLDLAKAPHMLVAGATGTGKSVCSNSLITSLLFKFKPDELRLIMVDPKIVEFDAYKTLPHLLTPIINDSAKVPIALRWAANEMDRRYHVLAQVGVKKLSEFNSRPVSSEPEYDRDGNLIPAKMPLLVIILDELADLMMTEAKKDVETNITRIAQKGRAAGIHIIVATQRPSTNIITGVIKANLPTRLCFQVRSRVDSQVVLDTPGSEKLLGMGDMLVMTSSSMEIERVQGAWVKDDDIKSVVKFVSDQAPQHFNDTVLAENDDSDEEIDPDDMPDDEDLADIAPILAKYMRPGDDDTMRRALEVVVLDRKASTSYLQRRLKIGYNRAAELIDQMEERGIVGPPSGSGNKREILVFDGIDIG
ncbi:MAG: DNA translocase FtsK 4TM domain-containing protein [Lentisphaeria bacterium]|nr:DNA translocase FtsK 4TM domain-containing protein [Lentisphaeria bacterium]